MGEYITIGDFRLKVGVMDDFRYVRREELEGLNDIAKETEEIRLYLEDERTLYRFPFPWEDDKPLLHNGREMFKTVSLRITPEMNDFEHGHIVKNVECTGRGHGVNIWIPCILGEKGCDLKTSRKFHVITIFGERQNEGGRYTVFRCGYCETAFAMDQKNINKVRDINNKISLNGEKYWMPRILERLKPKMRG